MLTPIFNFLTTVTNGCVFAPAADLCYGFMLQIVDILELI